MEERRPKLLSLFFGQRRRSIGDFCADRHDHFAPFSFLEPSSRMLSGVRETHSIASASGNDQGTSGFIRLVAGPVALVSNLSSELCSKVNQQHHAFFRFQEYVYCSHLNAPRICNPPRVPNNSSSFLARSASKSCLHKKSRSQLGTIDGESPASASRSQVGGRQTGRYYFRTT